MHRKYTWGSSLLTLSCHNQLSKERKENGTKIMHHHSLEVLTQLRATCTFLILHCEDTTLPVRCVTAPIIGFIYASHKNFLNTHLEHCSISLVINTRDLQRVYGINVLQKKKDARIFNFCTKIKLLFKKLYLIV